MATYWTILIAFMCHGAVAVPYGNAQSLAADAPLNVSEGDMSETEVMQTQQCYESALSDLEKWRDLPKEHNAHQSNWEFLGSNQKLFDALMQKAHKYLEVSKRNATTKEHVKEALAQCCQTLLHLFAIQGKNSPVIHVSKGGAYTSYANAHLQSVSASHLKEPLPKLPEEQKDTRAWEKNAEGAPPFHKESTYTAKHKAHVTAQNECDIFSA